MNLPTSETLLPRWVTRAAERVRPVVRRLPVAPPSFVAARLLDRFLLPRLDAGQRQALSGHVVEVELAELGARVRLILGAGGFAVAPAGGAPTLLVKAQADALWLLVRGESDADRLFFERRLVIEGDTEYGLILKNTLDAIGPLWQ